MLRVAMSAKGFPFEKSVKDVHLGWPQRPSTERGYEEHPKLSDVSMQTPDVKRLLGIWVSALALFMGRLLLAPLQPVRQPFYKRFLWAALMACLPTST
jgi:hypothetical protein